MVASLIILIGLTALGAVSAQEATVEPVAEETATLIAPTEVPPTEIPTEVIPTEAPPTEPPEATSVVEIPNPTEEIPSTPPTFTTIFAEPFSATANTLLSFQVSVADDKGIVRLAAESAVSGASISVTASTPAEASAPFITVATIDYIAPESFIGADSFTLKAIDADGQMISVVIQIQVAAPVITEVVPTAEPSPVDRTEPLVKELIINYDPAASEAALQQFLIDLGAEEIDRIPQLGAMLIRVPQRISEVSAATTAAGTLVSAAQIGFRSAEENSEVSNALVPNDPQYGGLQWGLKDTGEGTWVQTAWNHSTQDGLGVIVAVLDGGVDYQHPDLVGQLLPGYDFVNDDNNADDDDDVGHGTHVAGVIAAKTNNAIGIAGVAFNAKILPVKVLDSTGNGSSFWIAQGIVYAVDRGAKVINMSLGGDSFSSTQNAAVDYALSRSVIVIAAAGNTSGTAYQYPASYDGVISVAAHDINALNASFSTENDRVWISAPGVNIYSLTRVELGGYVSMNGTSMAAPHVAGVAALLVASKVATTPAAVREALACGARDVNYATLFGRDDQMGWGVLDADFAMRWTGNSAGCKIPQPNDNFETPTLLPNTAANIIQPIHSRSVTPHPSDPSNCGTPYQSLWYTFRPTTSGYYHITTLGSSYDTSVGVYQGNQGALRLFGCGFDTGYSNHSIVNPQLTAGQLYHIMVDSDFLGGFNDQVVQLQVKPAMETPSLSYENSSLNIAYTGTWASTPLTGSSGGTYHMTTDNSATASFTVVGDFFTLYRVVGPTMGDIEVWIDGVPYDSDFNAGNGVTPISSRAAFTKGNVDWGIGLGGTGLHEIIIKRRTGGTPGPIGLDRIAVGNTAVGTLVLAMTDDRLLAPLKYSGVWSQVGVPGAHLNTITRTTAVNAELFFRAKGSTITILRSTAPGYGTANVYVDGKFYGIMQNGDSTGLKVPYVISDLSPSDHVIRIVNNGTLDIDAVQPSSPAAIAAKSDERLVNMLYTGNWLNEVTPGAFVNTTRSTSDTNARIDFTFSGNYLCIGYVQQPGGGSFTVQVDALNVDTINTNGVFSIVTWCSHTSPTTVHGRQMYFTGQHFARINRNGPGVLELDFIQPGAYNLLTPARGVVQESDPTFTYSGVWASVNSATPGPNALSGVIPPGARSFGGFLPMGGTMRRTNVDNSSATFFINGTGFVLYTSVSGVNGCMHIVVDGSGKQFVLGTTTENAIDFVVGTPRFTPWAFAVTDLSRGIHKVELRADTNCSWMSWGPLGFNGFYVDIDAVRVFP